MRNLVWLTLGFALGAVAFLYVSPSLIPLYTILPFLILIFIRTIHWRRFGWIALGVLCCTAMHQHMERTELAWAKTHLGEGSASTMTASNYGFWNGKSTEIDVDLEGQKGLLTVVGRAEVAPGDTIVTDTDLELTKDTLYLRAEGYVFRGFTFDAVDITSNHLWQWKYLPQYFAHEVSLLIDRLFADFESGVLHTLFLGQRHNLDDQFYGDMKTVGISHTFAISGMHIALLLAILWFILGKYHVCNCIALGLVWFYAVAVGATPSVIRAIVLWTFLESAIILRKPEDTATSICGGLLLILLMNPYAIASVSLQFSFGAVICLCLFSEKVMEVFGKLKKRVRKILMPLGASIAVIPVSLVLGSIYFGMFSMLAPLSNLVLQPLITLLFAGTLPVLCIGYLWLPLGRILAYPICWLIGLIRWIVGGLANIPLASIYTVNDYMMVFMVFLLVVILICFLGKYRPKILVVLPCTLFFFGLCYWVSALEYDHYKMNLTMVDVGQGQCIFLESGGMTLLYDCGGSASAPAELATRQLQGAGKHSFDGVIVSHYDYDHCGGVADLLRTTQVNTLYLPPITEVKDIQREILLAALEMDVPVVFVENDMAFSMGEARANLYAPISQESANEASLSLLYSQGTYDVLMTGDMGKATERILTFQKSIPDLEVLVAGHHGSKHSTSQGFLDRVTPETVLVSVGKDNSYGHPNTEVLARLANEDIAVYRTDLLGNITLRR